jgi:hypothetical protein
MTQRPLMSHPGPEAHSKVRNRKIKKQDLLPYSEPFRKGREELKVGYKTKV